MDRSRQLCAYILENKKNVLFVTFFLSVFLLIFFLFPLPICSLKKEEFEKENDLAIRDKLLLPKWLSRIVQFHHDSFHKNYGYPHFQRFIGGGNCSSGDNVKLIPLDVVSRIPSSLVTVLCSYKHEHREQQQLEKNKLSLYDFLLLKDTNNSSFEFVWSDRQGYIARLFFQFCPIRRENYCKVEHIQKFTTSVTRGPRGNWVTNAERGSCRNYYELNNLKFCHDATGIVREFYAENRKLSESEMKGLMDIVNYWF